MEMVSVYNLVECIAIHNDTSYHCVVDSGSCLNIINWKTVTDFGLGNELLRRSLGFKVADGHVAHTMGEVIHIELGYGDCVFDVSFAVVDSMDHMLLLGNSFMHKAKVILNYQSHDMTLTDKTGTTCCIPITYHRSHDWVKTLESDERCWPSDKKPSGEGAPMPVVKAVLPHFSTILEECTAKVSVVTGASASPSFLSTATTVAASSVEIEIEEMVLETDGQGPSPGLFPLASESSATLPSIFSVAQAVDADQQDKSDWQILPRIFNSLSQDHGPFQPGCLC